MGVRSHLVIVGFYGMKTEQNWRVSLSMRNIFKVHLRIIHKRPHDGPALRWQSSAWRCRTRIWFHSHRRPCPALPWSPGNRRPISPAHHCPVQRPPPGPPAPLCPGPAGTEPRHRRSGCQGWSLCCWGSGPCSTRVRGSKPSVGYRHKGVNEFIEHWILFNVHGWSVI